MIKIAIAGNIASGKSAVENVLLQQGFSVLDTDKSAHELLIDNKEVVEAFKDFDIFEQGHISRAKLGKLVFSDNELKKKLENILHPQIRMKINEFFEKHKQEPLVFVSIPLLFEAGMEDLFDKILFIYANDDIRLERLIKRNNYTQEYALTRMNAQVSQDEKISRANWVIYNNSTVQILEQELVRLIEQIR